MTFLVEAKPCTSTIGSPINKLGMAGVAPNVTLVNLRAGQDSGYFFLQPSVDALNYAGDHGIDVVNMSYFIDSAGVKHFLFGEGGGQRIADFAKAPLIGQVPLEPKVREWRDKGTPIVQAMPASELARAFARIADSLTELIAKRHFERQGSEKAPNTSGPRRLKIVR